MSANMTYLIPRDIDDETKRKLVAMGVQPPMGRNSDSCSLCTKAIGTVSTGISAEIGSVITLKSCNHHFHAECYNRSWTPLRSHTCNTCRAPYTDIIVWNSDEMIAAQFPAKSCNEKAEEVGEEVLQTLRQNIPSKQFSSQSATRQQPPIGTGRPMNKAGTQKGSTAGFNAQAAIPEHYTRYVNGVAPSVYRSSSLLSSQQNNHTDQIDKMVDNFGQLQISGQSPQQFRGNQQTLTAATPSYFVPDTPARPKYGTTFVNDAQGHGLKDSLITPSSAQVPAQVQKGLQSSRPRITTPNPTTTPVFRQQTLPMASNSVPTVPPQYNTPRRAQTFPQRASTQEVISATHISPEQLGLYQPPIPYNQALEEARRYNQQLQMKNQTSRPVEQVQMAMLQNGYYCNPGPHIPAAPLPQGIQSYQNPCYPEMDPRQMFDALENNMQAASFSAVPQLPTLRSPAPDTKNIQVFLRDHGIDTAAKKAARELRRYESAHPHAEHRCEGDKLRKDYVSSETQSDLDKHDLPSRPYNERHEEKRHQTRNMVKNNQPPVYSAVGQGLHYGQQPSDLDYPTIRTNPVPPPSLEDTPRGILVPRNITSEDNTQVPTDPESPKSAKIYWNLVKFCNPENYAEIRRQSIAKRAQKEAKGAEPEAESQVQAQVQVQAQGQGRHQGNRQGRWMHRGRRGQGRGKGRGQGRVPPAQGNGSNSNQSLLNAYTQAPTQPAKQDN
ncbi:hypothetical protein EDC01DRAFT_758897 [Geopyxis carbonaria]|nr:hypothetical protein EDC01DRAFT_758897 [Geopyxis carbonaria]